MDTSPLEERVIDGWNVIEGFSFRPRVSVKIEEDGSRVMTIAQPQESKTTYEDVSFWDWPTWDIIKYAFTGGKHKYTGKGKAKTEEKPPIELERYIVEIGFKIKEGDNGSYEVHYK